MFLFLASLSCVAAAETGTNAHCRDPEQSPHLHQRAWVDGDRHCSYRDSVVFESHTREFDRIVCRATGSCSARSSFLGRTPRPT